MQVEMILQSKGVVVHTIVESDRVADAVRVLNERNIGAVVVTDESGAVSGILSERDVVRNLQGDGAALMFKPVSAIMTPKPVTCGPGATVDELMHLMTKRRIRHVPVVEDGKLVGLVSIGDVVKRKIAETEEEAAALRNYIAS